ncbi:MAG: hypothetical protein IT456_11405, partial [Planctomycetes bacterium]|nr:hypothetical protein [Planctomycetota bacterium]
LATTKPRHHAFARLRALHERVPLRLHAAEQHPHLRLAPLANSSWKRIRPYLDKELSSRSWPEIVILLAERNKNQGETIGKLRHQLEQAEKYSERLKVPLLPSGSLPPNYLHTAHVPGDWSSMADEWFIYHRHYVMGEPTPFVMVSWRHGPGVSNSAEPRDAKWCAHVDVDRAEIAEAHVQALCGAAKSAIRAMGRAWSLVGASEQPALDRAQVALASVVTAAQ